jgi:hypothetical protein
LLGTVRRRSIPFEGPNNRQTVETVNGTVKSFTNNGPNGSGAWDAFQGTQVTESENHSGWQYRFQEQNRGSRVYVETPDRGGDFTTQKSYVSAPEKPVVQRVTSGWFTNTIFQPQRETVYGALRPAGIGGIGSTFPPSAKSSDAQLAAFGTEAIARCAPTNQVANFSTALLELYHDGAPKLLGSLLWKERAAQIRDVARQSGSEYLNVQFGWKPLLADITDFMSGVRNLNKLINQYKRDAGRQVRRRYSFPPVQSFSESVVLENATVAIVGGGRNSLLDSTRRGQVVRSRETTVRRWFSGAFTYHLPDPGSWQSEHSGLAAKFLGVDITPETLWELAPWSWAVDWFTNVGDLIHNANRWSADGLVLRYGYVMEHSIVRDTYTHIGGNGFVSINANVFPEAYTFCTETKLRRRATPFGFGVNLSALTSQQNAIIAALGLSHLR